MIQFDIASDDITLDDLLNRTKRINEITKQVNAENASFKDYIIINLEQYEDEQPSIVHESGMRRVDPTQKMVESVEHCFVGNTQK